MSNLFFQSNYIAANPIGLTVSRTLTVTSLSSTSNFQNLNLKFNRKLEFRFNHFSFSNVITFLRGRNLSFKIINVSKINNQILYSRITSISNFNNSTVFNNLNFKRKYHLTFEKQKYSFPYYFDDKYIDPDFIDTETNLYFIISRFINFSRNTYSLSFNSIDYKLNKKIQISTISNSFILRIDLLKNYIRSSSISSRIISKNINIKYNKYILINTNFNSLSLNFQLLKKFKLSIESIYSNLIDRIINLTGTFFVRLAKRKHRIFIGK